MAKLTRILSIDGGGIRGIIPGKVLVSLEQKLKKATNNQDARVADYFDLIAGTSTGGILTCVYLCPDLENNPKRPRFSADDAVELYMEWGDEIFDVALKQRLTSIGGWIDEKYSEDALEEVLNDYFKDLKLSQLLKPCLITTFDVKRYRTKFFTQHDAIKHSMHDYYVKDIARSTSAAPTYFEAARIKSLTNVPYPLIDGGVFANNPALCAYAEVRQKFKSKPTAKDMIILSLGTGFAKKQYNHKTVKDWGKIEWVQPVIDIMMSGVSETVDYQLRQIFDAIGKTKQYLRVNSELLFASPELDDASQENLTALKQEGTRIAEEFDKQLDSMINLLIQK